MQREIDYLELELEDSESELDRWVNGDLQKVRITKDSKCTRLESTIASLKLELDVLYARRSKLLDFIYKFDDLDSQILIKKYIEGKKLEVVAEEVGYSYGYVLQLHARLVKTIRLIDKINP